MKKKTESLNGHSSLEASLQALLQSQVMLSQNQATFNHQMTQMNTQYLETQRKSEERFGRIEATMAEIFRILAEHSRMLQALPEAVRDKIGFKPQ